MAGTEQESTRHWLSRVFTWVEDIVYVGLGVLLAGCALSLLVAGAGAFWRDLLAGSLAANIIELLDRPFLMVGLMVVRRLLVLTAELPHLLENADANVFRQVLWSWRSSRC